jgi:LysR family carnitine catabolism transcriptional activator
MNVTLRQLRVFIAVAEAQHFTRAGDAMNLSQSTVSAQVRELEANLGLRLFDRHTRMLRLTAAGMEILPLARKAVADLDSVIGSSSQLKALGRGRVSMAVASVQAALVVPRLIREYTLKNPGVKIVLHDVAQDEVLDMVRAGEVDFGVGTASDTRTDLSSRVLWSEAFVAMLPHKHRLASKREVTWKDIQGEPLIGPHADNPLREHLDLTLAQEGISLTRLYEVSLPLTIIGMVEGGLGIGVMTTSIARVANALGLVLKKITHPVVERDVALIYHPDRSFSPAAKHFHDLLISRRADLSGH